MFANKNISKGHFVGEPTGHAYFTLKYAWPGSHTPQENRSHYYLRYHPVFTTMSGSV